MVDENAYIGRTPTKEDENEQILLCPICGDQALISLTKKHG